MKTYYISDTHFGHGNIVYGTSKWPNKEESTRRFDTIKEHDNTILEAINKVVTPRDRLIMLGDFSFHYQPDKWLSQIKCRNIQMIVGNHDKTSAFREYKVNWLPDIYEHIDHNIKVVCSHYPIESWNGQHKGAIHLHGHVHNRSRLIPNRLDVGVESLFQRFGSYAPVDIYQIKEYLDNVHNPPLLHQATI